MSDINFGAVKSLTSKATRVPGLPLQYPGERKKGAARPTGCASDHGDTNPPPIGTGGSAGQKLTPDENSVARPAVVRGGGGGAPPPTRAAKIAWFPNHKSGLGQRASPLSPRLSAVGKC